MKPVPDSVLVMGNALKAISTRLEQAEDGLSKAKERLRIVLEAKEWQDAELYLKEEVLSSKNLEERKARHILALQADDRMIAIGHSEHERRQEVAVAEQAVNRLTREFRIGLAVMAYSEARVRALAAGFRED